MEKASVANASIDFAHLFKTMPGAYLVLSTDFCMLAASKGYLCATLKSREEIEGKYIFDVFPDNPATGAHKSSATLRSSLQQAILTKQPQRLPASRYDIPLPGKTEKGFEERYWEVINTPVQDDEGEVQYILHEVRNITQQVMAEREIASTHDNLHLMSKVAGAVMWECDVQADRLVWSESLKEFFGYTDKDLVNTLDSWNYMIHPDDRTHTRHSLDYAMAKGQKSWTGEYRFRRKDGTYAQVVDHGYIFYNPQQIPIRMLGSIVDVTRQKQQELKLQESHDRFQRLAMATNDVIWDWDLVHHQVWWNEGFKTLFGYTDEVLQQEPGPESWTNRIHPDDLEHVTHSIHHTIDHGLEWKSEYRFRCADGNYKLVLDKGYVIRNPEGQPVRMVGAMVDITEQRRTAQQLQDTMQQTLDILESLPLMTWTATPDGLVDYYSQSWYKYTGSDFESMKDWGWQHLIHPDDWEPTRQLWLECISESKPFVIENRFRKSNGEYRWFLVRAVPLRNSEGLITMWVGSHTDIHDQKQMLLQLEESNSKFMMLAESIPHIVWSGNPDGYVDYFNGQWYAYTKMTQEETLGFGWGPSLHPDDKQPTVDDWLHSMRTGEKYERELRLRDINTEDYRWFLARALPARNAEGEIIKWFGTATYIHEQKLLREQLEESEKQFRFLAESIPQMVWTTRPDGYHDYFNKRWLDYTGLSMEESMGMVWNSLLHPDDRERAWKRWQFSLQTGEFYEIEYRFKNGFNGTYRWFLGQAMPMRDDQGNIVRWFGTCTDIEDHKRAEEELVEKNLELERINQDLDSFVYTASHDLKLPIINIAGIFSELTRGAQFNDPDAPKLIEMFNKAVRQLHATIHDLSEVVRVQKTKDQELEDVPLQETAEDVIIGLQDLIKDSNAQIDLDFSAAASVPFTRSSLKSVLFNLISNAIKYRSPERVPEISIRSVAKDNFVELRVQDNGLGIDMNKHESKLFQMFKRFHNHVQGSGLGLYIVNRLLMNHGGYINIDSALNKGSTFTLYFKKKKA